MAFTKPSTINSLWATSGTRVVPPSSKRSLGWIAEKPSYQYFNDILYKLGQANAYFNSRGVAEWDDETEYVGEKSYIVGSDGSLYKCLVTNTDQNPVLDDGTYWKIIANGQGSEAWNILFPYEAGALVLHDSELWLATAYSTGSEPSGVNTDWDKLVRNEDLGTAAYLTTEDVYNASNLATGTVPLTRLPSEVVVESELEEVSDAQFGVSQVYTDLLASRALSMTYTNTSDRPIFISVSVTGQNCAAEVTVGGVVAATSVINGPSGSSSTTNATAVVPAGLTYSVSNNSLGVLSAWRELS